MSRLPNPGSDDGKWGVILNDFLLQSHNTAGGLKPRVISSDHLDSQLSESLSSLAQGITDLSSQLDGIRADITSLQNALNHTPPATPSASYALFGSLTPVEDVVDNGVAVELGTRFYSDISGSVTGVRFYKGANNTGVHLGTLWTASGTPLASVTFQNETTSGWQTQLFDNPVRITANTDYVVSYFSPTGFFSRTVSFFTVSPYVNGALHAPESSSGRFNGVAYYGGRGMPTQPAWNESAYFVDPVFSPDGE